VSRSLGPAQLREIFQLAAGRPGVRVVFRGVGEGERLVDFLAEIHALLTGIEPVPEVVLDPMRFRSTGVETVPALVADGPDGERARVYGLADPAWLQAQLAAGRHGDLGVRGPTGAVSEPDLIEELQRRVAVLDLVRLREQALARYWSRVELETLPVAASARERDLDPTLSASADLRLPDGTVLVAAGTRLNPLDRLPFSQRLVVFDATDPAQIGTARRLGASAGGRRVTYLATRLDRSRGWQGLEALEDTLDAPVYLLTPGVRARFGLERVPAYVEAVGRAFRVTEVPPGTGP
jgi:conjugal transfer pilus assembly protein TraW